MIYDSITKMIGNTPVLKLTSSEKRADIYVKLEYFNPGGSVKDRIALNMIEDLETRGILKKGMILVEPTSGNTGIGIAYVAAAKGYRSIFVMPETMSVERRQLMKAYGGEIILTEGKKGMKGAIVKVEELLLENSNMISLSQFENEANPEAHIKTTALELIHDFGATIDAFVAGVGTGGTITGNGKVLKAHNPHTQIIAVEPSDSPVISGGDPAPHKLQGIGAGFIPTILNVDIIDEVIQVTSSEAIAMVNKMATKYGVFLGISSGAAIHAAYSVAQKLGSGKKVVVIAPDSGERYLSTELFQIFS